MTEREIVQNLIFDIGQSQTQRTPAELDVHYADVDDRTPDELFRFVRAFAGLVNFYQGDDANNATGSWAPFFPSTGVSLAGMAAAQPGSLRPDLALLGTFFELYQHARARANELTRKHLDFYYQRVLRMVKHAPVPDRAHVLLELKKGALPFEIRPEHAFSAGKDGKGVEQIYLPVRRSIVNRAAVDSLRTIYLDRRGHGTVRFAPIANSADGLGGELKGEEAKWPGFGHNELPTAEIGFAIASPVLRMHGGTRKVTLTLRLGGVDPERLNSTNLPGAFTVFLTGEKNWIEADVVQARIDGDVATWEFTIAANAPPIVDYNAAIHGYSYAADAPIVQLLLRGDSATVGYLDFAGVTVQSAQIAVEVSGITALTVENDAGAIDPKKAFTPFGPEPTLGSRLMIAYPEALNKRLTRVDLELQWKGAPRSFSSHYSDYGVTVSNSSFNAAVHFRDGTGTEFSVGSLNLFDSADAASPHTLTFTPGAVSAAATSAGHVVRALSMAGSSWSLRQAHKGFLARPILLAFRLPAPAQRAGFITFTLHDTFLHSTYRKEYVKKVLQYAKSGSGTPTILNEPYTPTIQSMSLSYRATTSVVPVSSTEIADFANPDVQFFQLTPFGPLREHGHQRAQFVFLGGTDVNLLPPIPHEGELLIGLADLHPDDSVTLLFQVASGSADPDLIAETVRWFVLCDNYWRALGSSELVLDTTNNLLTSGLVQVVVPREATTVNTVLPAGRIWLKAALSHGVNAVSQLVAVHANAVEVAFVDRGNDPSHLDRPLAANSITRLKEGLAPVKGVAQPFASSGGQPAERDAAFYTRVAERLRHKDRCRSSWDYERVVLEAFPAIHKVKCVPHANGSGWLTPGHVLLVVVPALHNRNAVDPLQPKVDANTISQVTTHVRARCAEQIELHVRNPRYQKIRLDFKVRFRTGFEFNYYRRELEQELIRLLSPWAFESVRDISFGGRVAKSALLDFVEERDYVDFVTDFRMYSFSGDTADLTDLAEAQPATPDTILVSDRTHSITHVA